jgi:hypothetical protein
MRILMLLLISTILPVTSCRNGSSPSPFPGPVPTHSLLILHTDYSDDEGEKYSPGDLIGIGEDIGDYWNANSYGGVLLEYTVSDLLRMPETKQQYIEGKAAGTEFLPGIMSDAMIAARDYGYILEQYDYFLWMIAPEIKQGGNGFPTGVAWASNAGFNLIVMETSHALNTKHSQAHKSTTFDPIGSGDGEDHRNPFDVMGSGVYGAVSHFNVRLKHRLGWLDDAQVIEVSTSGTYTISAQDLAEGTGPRALRIKRDETTNYWVEYRWLIEQLLDPFNGLTDNPWVKAGALILRAPNSWNYIGDLSILQSSLLDMTPQSLYEFHDAPLLEGQTFTDVGAGLSIKVVGLGGPSQKTIDIEVSLDDPRTPIEKIIEIAIATPPNPCTVYAGEVTFSATAFDPDAGTGNGDGVTSVRFYIFGTNGENPTISSEELTQPPYEWIVNTNELPDSGFSVIVTAVEPDGVENSEGQFFIVRNPD